MYAAFIAGDRVGTVAGDGRRMLYGWFVLAVAREYENLALACRLDGQAKQDPLTGLANRRYFNQVGELAIKQAMLQDHLCGDPARCGFFKKLNDCYGHQRGDEVLVTLPDAYVRWCVIRVIWWPVTAVRSLCCYCPRLRWLSPRRWPACGGGIGASGVAPRRVQRGSPCHRESGDRLVEKR